LEDRQAVNPDPLDDFFTETDDYWLSEDHLFDLQTAKDVGMKVPPALTTWEQHQETTEVELTIAKARQMVWEQGIAEIELHKKNVAQLPSGSSGIDKFYQHMFGSKSRVCRLFNDKLGISHEEYLHFLITYFKSFGKKRVSPTYMSAMIRSLCSCQRSNIIESGAPLSTFLDRLTGNLFGRSWSLCSTQCSRIFSLSRQQIN
jgi:hypothetical protein